jgi:hypothetical protein
MLWHKPPEWSGVTSGVPVGTIGVPIGEQDAQIAARNAATDLDGSWKVSIGASCTASTETRCEAARCALPPGRPATPGRCARYETGRRLSAFFQYRQPVLEQGRPSLLVRRRNLSSAHRRANSRWATTPSTGEERERLPAKLGSSPTRCRSNTGRQSGRMNAKGLLWTCKHYLWT